MAEGLTKRLHATKPMAPVREAMLSVMVAADYIRRQVDEACAAENITRAQYNVLRILRGKPEGHPRCDIIKRLVEAAPDVTRLIDRIEQRGFAERVRCEEDRRLSITRIRAEGMEVLQRLEPRMTAIEAEMEGRLTAREAKQLTVLTEKIYGGA